MGAIDAYLGKRVYCDTNFFIYLLENFPPAAPAVLKIATMIQAGDVAAFTSELALAEALVVPSRRGDRRLFDLYRDLIDSRDGLTVVPVTRDLWIEAAIVRAGSSFKLPDAVHIATARMLACEAFLTNDRGFSRLSDLAVLFLDDPALP